MSVGFNGSDPIALIRNMTNMGNKDMLEKMMANVDMYVDGGQLIQVLLIAPY